MNGTKTTFSEFECGGMPDMTSEVQEGVLVLSIVLDLIAGCFSAGFLFKMYQGIEIDHPIYAIVFSNISFSTGVSMTSFVLTLVDMYVSLFALHVRSPLCVCGSLLAPARKCSDFSLL